MSKISKIIVFGMGSVGELAHYYFANDSEYEVVAFTADKKYIKSTVFLKLPVVAFEHIEQEYSPAEYKIFIALGYAKINKVRAEKYHQAKNKGYKLVNYISSIATVFDNVEIGDNCFILEGNNIQPYVKIGNNVTLWSGNHIGHHSVIKDHTFISSHAVISGNVVVEPFCFIGVNAAIRNNVTIAGECVIGAGSLILKSTDTQGVYANKSSAKSRVPSNRIRSI